MFSDKIYRNAQNKFGEYQLQLFGEFLNQQSTLFDRLSVWDIDDDSSSSSSSSTATSVIQIISSSLNQINDFNEFYYNPDLSLYHLTRRHIRPIEIKNSLQNYENISKFQLIKTDNILNKIILTFYQLCDECEIIIKLCKKYAIKFLYINEDLCLTENSNNNNNNCNINNNNNNNNNQTINGAIFNNHNDKCYFKISKSLKFLCNTQYLIQYCVIISTTMLHQLAALYTNDADICLSNIQMEQIFTILGRLSKELIIFDEIFANSSFLKYWSSYKKTINSINGNTNNRKTSLNDFNDSEINSLINLLNELESKLFTGNLFQNFLDNTYQVKQQLNAKAIGLLSNHFQEHIRNVLDIISKYPTDLSEFHETDLLIEINALCVIFHNVFGQIDQKHIKNLIKYNSKYIGTALIGNVIWCPEHFLSKNAETLIKPYDKYFTDATKLRQIYIQKKVQNLPGDVKMYCSQISLWSLHMKSLLKMTICDLKSENFKQSCSLFLKGLQFAGQISYIIKSVTNLHHQLRLEMPSTCITSICKLIECLKIIREIFITNIEHILRINQCVIQYLQYKGLILITSAKKRLETESYSDRNVDALSALQIAEKCLCGTSSKSRIMLANLAVSVSNPNYLLSSDYTKFQKIMYRLELISQLQNHLFELCDPSFMYWNQSNLLINMKNNVDQTNPYTFIHLLKYADDCCKLLKYLNVDCLELSEEMKKNNYEKYKTEILDKLCVQTEIFLRIEVHLESLLQAEQHNQNKLLNPYMETIYDYRDLIKKFKIQLNGNHVTLKNSIEDYFTNTFYNLTTIALHDWKIYCEMRHLAQTKFDLYSIEDYLPNQTLEQGIDILEIMRNIHVFVSKYRYNMNNQIFVEQSSKNKYLNTIGIQHIANSLKTHGMGILNTSVNFTYQFLRKKFYTFSQFLYDEQIRSRLMKDLKYFRDNSEKLNQMYSYDRADHFNKGIRKLGLMSDGQSYLDLFRQLITHIGNAMGYIRLIRSGGIHANYNASMYLPNMNEDDYKFGKYSKESNLTDTTINAAENLEENIENLCNNASKKTEYFNLLLDAFSGFFRDPKNIHLKTFYLIIPPLTINFVEHMLMAKDKIYKNDSKLYYHRLYSNSGDNIGDNSSNSNHTTVGSGGGSSNSSSSNSTNYCDALFFDDGFAIGLMYILKLLNQIIEFNSLHWFESIKNKFDLERSKIITQQQNMSRSPSDNVHDEKLQQTLSLTEKRIKAYETEFKLLYYNLNSAKIFFQ